MGLPCHVSAFDTPPPPYTELAPPPYLAHQRLPVTETPLEGDNRSSPAEHLYQIRDLYLVEVAPSTNILPHGVKWVAFLSKGQYEISVPDGFDPSTIPGVKVLRFVHRYI